MKFQNYFAFLIVFIWIPLLFYFFTKSKILRNSFISLFSDPQKNSIFNFSIRNLWFKRIFLFSAMIFLTIAAARPQMGQKEVNLQSEGIDIAIVFDVSLSMLAEDEQPSRFEAAKALVFDAVSDLKGDRVALIPFAGAAFLQLPLTSDYNTFLSVLQELQPGIIENQGTSLGNAISLAVEALKAGNEGSDKLIVVVSDGEDPNINFNEIKELLKSNKINIAIMPKGTTSGAPIKFGDSYLKDDSGNTVISKLNRDFFEKALKELNAFEIKKENTLNSFLKHFKNKIKQEEKRILFFEERFQIPLFIGIIFFVLTIFTPLKNKKSIST